MSFDIFKNFLGGRLKVPLNYYLTGNYDAHPLSFTDNSNLSESLNKILEEYTGFKLTNTVLNCITLSIRYELARRLPDYLFEIDVKANPYEKEKISITLRAI